MMALKGKRENGDRENSDRLDKNHIISLNSPIYTKYLKL